MTALATTVRERPILFSAPMVRAILDGRKTQTRRVVKPRGVIGELRVRSAKWLNERLGWQFSHDRTARGIGATIMRCPYGQPGDRLWVREAFYIDLVPLDRGPLPKGEPECAWRESAYYRADGECCDQIPECACGEVGPVPWRPSIHMPRWASRLTLEITDVRVERVNDISENDARAEGATPQFRMSVRVGGIGRDENIPVSYRGGFANLWQELNGSRGYGWNANPWVWALSFRRIDP